jgi:sterol desaturase/sphingolipid hydroxylase (fatty acid hydroxylase superfamily)
MTDTLIISGFVVVHLLMLRSGHRGVYKIYLDRHKDIPTYSKLMTDTPLLAIIWFLFFIPLVGTVFLAGICFLFFLVEYETQVTKIFNQIGGFISKCFGYTLGPDPTFMVVYFGD